MKVTIETMDQPAASEMSSWKYDEPYDFYNMDDNEGTEEFLNGNYFKVLENGVLIGYCCFGNSAIVPIGSQYGAYPKNGSVDVGLGMKPELTGRGRGYAFVSSILEFAQSEFDARLFRLTVAHFNERAIALYKKLGFQPIMVFPMNDVEFITMEMKTA